MHRNACEMLFRRVAKAPGTCSTSSLVKGRRLLNGSHQMRDAAQVPTLSGRPGEVPGFAGHRRLKTLMNIRDRNQ